MVLSHEYFNAGMLVACLFAFVSFSAAASAIYILNDFFDLALDRQAPDQAPPAFCQRAPVHALRLCGDRRAAG